MTFEAQSYAEQWIADWNTRELSMIMPHYAEDVVFRSPVAARVRPETGGIIVGKPALADYWGAALAQVPDLHFTLETVFASVDALTIAYRNQRGHQVAETLVLGPDGLVTFGMGAYA
jgi:ketosteroid isomerase-like protein